MNARSKAPATVSSRVACRKRAAPAVLTTTVRKVRTRWLGTVHADGRLVLTVRGRKRYVRVFAESFCEAWADSEVTQP